MENWNWPLIIAVLTALAGIFARVWGIPKSLTSMSESVSQIPQMAATVKELKQEFRDSQQAQWVEINAQKDKIASVEGDVKSMQKLCDERHRAVPRRRVG
jgi:Tfp pilus assembly protein PilO